MWDDSKYISFDFETSGELPEYALQPWRVFQGRAWVTSLATVRKTPNTLKIEGGLAVGKPLTQVRDMIAKFLAEAIANKWTVVGWNVAFDISWLLAYGFEREVNQLKFLDGMLLWKHLVVEPEYDIDRHKKRSYRLKAAVAEILPQFAGYESDVDFHATDPVSLAKLQKYNEQDTMFTLRLTRHFYNELVKEPQRLKAALIEADCLPLVAKANLDGMIVDVDTTTALGGRLVQVAEDMLTRLAPHGVTEKVVRSPKQLSKLLFEDWGLPVLKQNVSARTGNVTDSTDKEVLHELSFTDPRAAEIRLYREALGNKTKFVDAPLKSVDYNTDGRTHPLAMVFGTYTSRMTYASKQGRNKDERQIGFALHQMKRGKDFRSIIAAPPGYTLMEFDAAGQEFRWMAIASGDETMLELCLPGEDPHGFMGARIRHMDYRELVAKVKAGDKDAKDGRQLGKVGNLSCIAEGQKILTDRGFCNIESVTIQDKLWDGVTWVSHGGVVYMGEKDVITYQGITATADHRVLVAGRWVEIQEAARHGWRIESSLGTNWKSRCWSAVRIMDGIILRAISTVRRIIRTMPLRLRYREGGEYPVHGDRPVNTVPELRCNRSASPQRQVNSRHTREEATAKTRQRSQAKMYQHVGQGIQQLRRARDRISVYFRESRRRVYTLGATPSDICWVGYGQDRRERTLRTGEPTVCNPKGKRSQQKTYDILNAGPRVRFSVGFSLVHNCQYRTSSKKLRSVARVQYGIPMDLPEAEQIHAAYQASYPGVPNYWRNQIAMTKRLGYVETFAGRRVQVVGNWRGPKGWSMESTSINYRIQGTGGDQKYLALSVLRPYITRIGAVFAWELHDGIYLYVPDAMVERAATEIPYLLANLPYKKAWGFTPPIPLPWDCKHGKSWGELKEWK